MSIILETKNVSKISKTGSNEVKAIDSASFQIHEGEFIGLVGPSGSGKTTMLAMLAALLIPTNGEVFINGVDLGEISDSDRVKFRRENIGFTFQSNNLVPFLTVRENVELMLRLNGRFERDSRNRVEELLERLGICDRIDSLPSQLSGGQRVSIARSLVHNPSVVLADEPTASLDSERAYQVTRLYADLIHEQKKAGIMVTHDMRMCVFVDRIIQISDGKIQSIIDDRAEIDSLINCG
jgi:putative ABC transport system ATP-binding protein